MNIKKISLITGSFFIIGLLAFIGCGGCGPRGHFCSDKFPDRILKRMDKKVAKLELNNEQQKFYNEIRADIKSDLIKFKDEKLKVHDEVTEELKNDNPDIDKIAETFKKKHAEHPAKFDAYIDRFVEFYKMLNDEQKKIIIERARDMSERFNCD